MYFLAGKNGIRKLTDYRYRIPGATPTPTGEGEKNLRITGIGSPYEQYNGDYRRDQSAVYATPGTAGQQWTQDGGGMLTINSSGQWALTMGNVTSISDKLATAGWPWESVFLWDSMGQTVTMVIAALDDDNPESAWRQIVGDDMICSASGNFQIGDDTHAIILGKDYPVVSVGSDEIAQLWTGENLNVGELGFYYNGDPAIGAVYGSLVGADMATMLDYKLRGVEYNPSIDGRIDFNSFLPVFRSIGTGDFELEIKFDLGQLGKNAYIFQMPASNTTACLGVWVLTSTDGSALIQSSCMLIGTSYQLLAVPYTTGIHTAEISRVAGTVKVDIDGTSQSWTGDAIDLSTATMLAPYNNADCILHSVKLTSGGVTKWAIDGVPPATPSRYTLPSQAHLNALVTLAGGSAIAGKMLKSAGSVSDGGAWADPPEGSEDAVGIDRFGFAMLPGGLTLNGTSQSISQRGLLLGLDPTYAGARFLDFYYYNAAATLNSAGAANAVAASVRALKTRGELVLGGQRIPTVLIGLQSWTAENDRDTQFSTPRNDAALEAIYGPVYNYQQTLERDAALAASGSCWRVPRWDEYQILTDNTTVDMLKSREGWEANSGKNTSGFNALPGGRTAASTYVGQQAMLGTVTPGSTANTWWALALTSSSQTPALGTGGLVTGFSLRLVKRFYDVLMPWGQMLRFVKIGSTFIAQRNLDWRGDSIPRDFSKYPLLQERYIQAINARWDLTHQYKLRAKITLFAGFDKAKNYNIFAQNFAGNTNGPVGLVWHPDYGMRGVSNQYGRATNQVVVTNTKVDLDAGTYDVEVSTEPTTVRLKVGSHDVIDRDGVRLNEVKPTVANVVSNFPGTIESLMVEDTTTGETIFEASKAELRGGLGRYYNDDPALAYLGMYYTFEEHNLIITELAKAGMPIATMDTTQWQALSTYNSGAAATQGLHLCDPGSFTSPPDGMDDVYELGLLAGGAINQNGNSVSLGSVAYYMHRAGLYGVNGSGAMVGWYNPDQLMSTYKDLRATIRLCYAVS